MKFNRHALDLDPAQETHRIEAFLAASVRRTLRRNGAVVGISGGLDSSVVLALAARTFGPERVRAVMMPEHDSDPLSETLARKLAGRFGVTPVKEELTPVLTALGCYRQRDEAIRRIFPQYDPELGYRAKIVLPSLLDQNTLNVFSVTILSPDGVAHTKPLPAQEFREIVAASNFKQRMRMATLYHHAEMLNYAVLGTPNKNEHDLGFFVKHGDGGADVMPIVHLFKTQVYQLAAHLGVPEEIIQRTPTTDTYSAPATQEEFFFRISFEVLDLLWFAMEQKIPVAEIAAEMHLSEDQVMRVHSDVLSKRRATEYLRMAPMRLPDHLILPPADYPVEEIAA